MQGLGEGARRSHGKCRLYEPRPNILDVYRFLPYTHGVFECLLPEIIFISSCHDHRVRRVFLP